MCFLIADASAATDSLFRVIREIYEPSWTGHSDVALTVDVSYCIVGLELYYAVVDSVW